MRVGVLGAATTFAGQAAGYLAGALPSLPELGYFPTVDEVWGAVRAGAADAALIAVDTTHGGWTPSARRVVRDGTRPAGWPVLLELVVPYRCQLLGKPGTTLDDVRAITGHGSIDQCGDFLDEVLPHASRIRHRANSAAAAADVWVADGELALVGTAAAARENGLAVLASDIDRGSVGVWWLIGCHARPAGQGEPRLKVAVRDCSTAQFVEFAAGLTQLGLTCRSLGQWASGVLHGRDFLAVLGADEPSQVPGLAEVKPLCPPETAMNWYQSFDLSAG